MSRYTRSTNPTTAWGRIAYLAVILFVGSFMIACDSTTSDDAVPIGPGSDDAPPAEEVLDEEPGDEPVWTGGVPAVAQPAATQQAQMTALAVAGSNGLEAPPTDGPTGATEDALGATYVGTMDIQIAYYNYCQTYDGNLGYAGSAEYTMTAEAYINPPAEDAGVQERSPFNLIVATEMGVEGSLLLVSGQVVTNTLTGENVLIDYWDIDESDDGSITGVLTDRWPGLAYNYIVTAQPIVPCQSDLVLALKDDVAEGAELAGTVTDDHIHLEVLAQSLDREVRFFATIDADVAA